MSVNEKIFCSTQYDLGKTQRDLFWAGGSIPRPDMRYE